MKVHPRPATHRGFTLIELLVTIGIIGVLVAILVPTIRRVRIASQGATTSAQMAAIGTAIQAYYSDFRAYPGPIPNNQLGYGAANPAVLELGTTSAAGTTDYTTNAFDSTQLGHITGAENLVLGLLGGLELDTAGGNKVAYNPVNIFANASGPTTLSGAPAMVGPKGATSLNAGRPKRTQAYLQASLNDLSNPYSALSLANKNQFTDSAGRTANDSIIPEFVDQFSEPLPILYMRANPGAIGVVSRVGKDETGNSLVAPYQYDLSQVLGYTGPTSAGGYIGATIGNAARDHHGLQDIEPSGGAITDSITVNWGKPGQNGAATGANALVYLKDPNTPPKQSDGTTLTTNKTASPRQKDAFILISAGPDGVYGTTDDIIYPGSLNP